MLATTEPRFVASDHISEVQGRAIAGWALLRGLVTGSRSTAGEIIKQEYGEDRHILALGEFNQWLTGIGVPEVVEAVGDNDQHLSRVWGSLQANDTLRHRAVEAI